MMASLDLLREEIKEIIYCEVPLNNVCPSCGSEIEPHCLIDKDSKMDKQGWDKMVGRIIATVLNWIPETEKGDK